MASTLAPVTAGNVVGGGVLVGAVYRVLYLRGRGEASAAPKGERGTAD